MNDSRRPHPGVAPEPSQPIPPGLPRLPEVLIALTLLILTLPILLLSWISIRLGSPGPAIFRQIRIGREGKPFELLKLRTMRSDVEGSLLTGSADHRVTTIGRVLRATKLDELPQLWNVVVGEMSLVGPRPEVPHFVDLESTSWRRVLSARPGITDPVSIRLRDEATWFESAGDDPEAAYREVLLPWKLAGYLEYLESRSPWRDLVVLWQTPIAVLFTAGEEIALPDPPGSSEPPTDDHSTDPS